MNHPSSPPIERGKILEREIEISTVHHKATDQRDILPSAKMQGLWSDHFPTAAKPPSTVSPVKSNGLWSEIFPAAAAGHSSPEPPPPSSVSPVKPNGLRPEISPAAVKKSPESSHRSERCLICRKCNAASCRLKKSFTPTNPHRQFYTCPSAKCGFFKWADEVSPDELVDVPYCGGCSAGVCRVRKEKSGPNAGRVLFMCRVKEGEGSCGYRVWQDELEKSAMSQSDERIASSQSTRVNCEETGTTNTDLVEESRQCNVEEDNALPLADTSQQHLQCIDVRSTKMEELKCLQEKPKTYSRRPHKRSRHGDLKDPESLISARCLTISLDMSFVSIEQCWMEAAIRQNLSTQLQGWWGRLAFHPMPCLVTYASKPPTFDSTVLVLDKTPVSPHDPITLTRSILGVESHKKPLFNPCSNAAISAVDPLRVALDVPPYHDIKLHHAMSQSISSAFNQAADLLQSDLLTRLESMDVKNHVAMTQAAEAIFSALDRLLFDSRDFKERVKELIHCAESLAEIEQSMPGNDSSHHKLVEKCSSERKRLDEINCKQMDVVDTVTNNKKRLNDLQEEIANAREWLFQIEAEMSCCEVEMRGMECELEKISKKMEVLEGKYMIASKELEESEKSQQRKEAERDAAKAAFRRARALLRG